MVSLSGQRHLLQPDRHESTGPLQFQPYTWRMQATEKYFAQAQGVYYIDMDVKPRVIFNSRHTSGLSKTLDSILCQSDAYTARLLAANKWTLCNVRARTRSDQRLDRVSWQPQAYTTKVLAAKAWAIFKFRVRTRRD